MINVPFRQILGLNQQTYQRLSVSLHLNLRRQIFIAVCDDLVLRDRLAAQLQTELTPSPSSSSSPQSSSHPPGVPYLSPSSPSLVSLQLSLDDPNPLLQIAQWLTQSPPPIVEGQPASLPAFQILGIEHLTRQSSTIQRLFFTYLQAIEQNLPLLDFSVLLWVTQPWFHALPDSAPEFWRCRTGVFEFIGDPTPLTLPSPERFGVQSSQAIGTTLLPASLDQLNRTLNPADSLEIAYPDSQIEETEFLPASETDEPTFTPVSAQSGSASQNSLSNAWSPAVANDLLAEDLLAEDLQEETETEGLSQDEISLLLGDLVLDSPVAPIDAEKGAEADPVEETQASPPAAAEEVWENPWLSLGESLIQLYEPSEAAENNQVVQGQTAIDPVESVAVADQVTNQVADQSAQADQIANSLTNQAVDYLEPDQLVQSEAAPTIAFTPIHLPEDLPQRPQIQSVLQKIEQLHQQRAAAMVLVDAYRSLGNLFRDRIEQGDVTPQNLIVAIQAYEQALLRLPDESPLWVDLLNDLGNLYWMASRTTPNSAEATACLNQAIQAYQLALSKIEPQSHSYPMVQNNLGAAYADLARHDNPTQNLQLSVQAYREALHWRRPETDPLRYASTQNNLGTTYWNLAQYQDPATNLKLAIAAYADAAQYYNPAEESLNYAMIQNNLGTAYWNLAQHDRSQDWLLSAVSAYQMALEYRTLDANPVAHAATQNNLGTAYWHIANETDSAEARVDYLQQAIVAYEGALYAVKQIQAHQPQAVPLLNFDVLSTHNNLGLAAYQIATDGFTSLDATKQSQYLQLALDHHVLAWQGWGEKDNLRQTAFSCIVQTIQAFYNQLGLPGQSLALSRVPGELLPDILPKL